MNEYDSSVITLYIDFCKNTLKQCQELFKLFQELNIQQCDIKNQNIDTLIVFFQKKQQEVEKINNMSKKLAHAHELKISEFNLYYDTFLKENHLVFANKLTELSNINNDVIKRLEFLVQETKKNKIADILLELNMQKKLNLKKKIESLQHLMFINCSLTYLVKKTNFAKMLKEVEEMLCFFEKQRCEDLQDFQEIQEDICALKFLEKQVSKTECLLNIFSSNTLVF